MKFECEIGREKHGNQTTGSAIQYTRPLFQHPKSQNTHDAVIKDMSGGVKEKEESHRPD